MCLHQQFPTISPGTTTKNMVAPTIVIIPGFWLRPSPYDLLVDELKKAAPSLTNIVFAQLTSTGTRSPGALNMLDDAMGIRAVIKPLVETGKRLVLIGHSSGAFLSAIATDDLEVGEKLALPSGGGVERFIFIAGGLLPAGAPHPPTNWEAKVSPLHVYRLERISKMVKNTVLTLNFLCKMARRGSKIRTTSFFRC